MSSAVRGAIFLFANMPAGVAAALRAMIVECGFRAVASGVLGSLTQSLRQAQPMWAGTITALIVMPVLGHSAEFAVHAIAGTPRLGASMRTSIAFTCLSTMFNLFAMRRGVLVVGDGGQSLARDLRALPEVVVAFARSVAMSIVSVGRYAWSIVARGRDRR